ncbi:transporter substrate-binding domain-containing protein [Vibrio sp. Isolate23]|uniref:substrate-binding periplasmic protein n=1 Tax=Vibrio sp. Isolate23 TaxID=2908533 RepID=UPI001EFDD1C9|nr:transporter substrate-binding domain-containing protein [Vibrio sp. Isolate23]MCG9681441.1 transporter substrate-binding domain-containing protein [Vibrio sp. Isolate23]
MSSNTLAKAIELRDVHLSICGDSIDWPPYTYLDGEDVKGLDLEVLNELLLPQNITFNFTMTSWTRCLKGTKNGEFQIAVSASHSEERAKHYLYTTWYYHITPYYLYKKSQFPQGISINRAAELEQYKVCGLHGYNYGDFRLTNVEQYTHSMHELVTELHQLRCEVILSWQEILEGIRNVWGITYVSEDIESKPIPNMPKHKFYMLISKQYEHGPALKKILDKGLRERQTK